MFSKKNYKLLPASIVMGLLVSSFVILQEVHADITSLGHQSATQVGGFGRNAVGGSQADATHIYTVNSRQTLLKALGQSTNDVPKIIYLSGTIDMTKDSQGRTLTEDDYAQGTGYHLESYLTAYNPSTWGKKKVSGQQEINRLAAQRKQAEQIEVKVPANTTIIGLPGASFVGGNLILQKNNIIVRNITFETPYDDFPQWDPTDERTGNWNSQYDAISVQGASNVWLDHNTFDDGRYRDSQNGTYFGREYQHHDGMTDITNGADNITISDSVYRNHDKTMLIGNSDSKTSDTGKLHVTLVRNLFQNTVQRTPRVRFGDVQVINNFYQNDGTSTYQFKYAWGLGKKAQINAKNNVFVIAKKSPVAIINKFKGTQLSDDGTIFNTKFVSAASISHTSPTTSTLGWSGPLIASKQLPESILQTAGSGVLK
ncbi:pectate lyase family protein [Leuconostoc citreum]|uniref:pectate lyase family protein n=1 Tax=Leuconostoc citreum TaxID=33964 RepID=UPI002A80511C|nr:pectate lyase [Leuconostoc citreum]MDY5162431.1 pectate lyase [Leuconostoc citreum]MDY5166073.1 pectate lyase [Leuconostoc citreum]